MTRQYLTVEEAVIGEVLPPPKRRRRTGAGGSGPGPKAGVAGRRTRSTGGAARQARFQRALRANVRAVPQAVIKRVVNGGVHDRKGLKNLLAYVSRDEAAVAVWHEQGAGVRDFGEVSIGALASDWEESWRGAPKRGHVDHIVVSFPKGTDAQVAAAIARDWGEAIFGSGEYGDRWRYVAALHTNTDQVHAHFAVEKHGLDEGRFLSISRHSEISYDVMKAVEVEIAAGHGLELAATSRLSRGIIAFPPRPTEVKALTALRHRTGEVVVPSVPPMSAEERAARLAAAARIAEAYDDAAALLALSPEAGAPETYLARLAAALTSAGKSLRNGECIVTRVDDDTALERQIEENRARFQRIVEGLADYPPSPERVQIATSLARAAAEDAILFPDARTMQAFGPAEEDPYRIDRITALAEAVESRTLDPAARVEAQTALDAVKTDFITQFGGQADALEHFGTTPEELAERFAAPLRGAAAIRMWDTRADTAETVLWAELRDSLAETAFVTAAEYGLPLTTVEALTRDAIRAAGADLPLSDIPALSLLAERVEEALSPAELRAVLKGSEAPLRDTIADPVLREAVFEELRYEAHLQGAPEATAEAPTAGQVQAAYAGVGAKDASVEATDTITTIHTL